MEMNKGIDECFSELIKAKEWHRGSPFDRKSAYYHKKIFREGKLSDNIKREYLKAAGYRLAQPEMWYKESD